MTLPAIVPGGARAGLSGSGFAQALVVELGAGFSETRFNVLVIPAGLDNVVLIVGAVVGGRALEEGEYETGKDIELELLCSVTVALGLGSAVAGGGRLSTELIVLVAASCSTVCVTVTVSPPQESASGP